MMAYEQRDNSGTLFKNKDKAEDKHPNAKGQAMIGGEMYEVAAWTKTSKAGDIYQSLSFKPLRASPQQRQAYNEPRAESPKKDPARNAGGGIADMADDVPW